MGSGKGFPQVSIDREASQSVTSFNIPSRLPHHAPHREARFRRTEEILHALVLETQLVEELVDIPPTPASQHHEHSGD